jgi:hypothetical protein
MKPEGLTYSKAFLPNKEGYKFVAILKDGSEHVVSIAKNAHGIHYIVSEVSYEQIKEWRRI